MSNHYTEGDYSVIRVVKEWGSNFTVGNALKYLNRYKRKHKDPKDDLIKAIDYIGHEITEFGDLSNTQRMVLIGHVSRIFFPDDKDKRDQFRFETILKEAEIRNGTKTAKT